MFLAGDRLLRRPTRRSDQTGRTVSASIVRAGFGVSSCVWSFELGAHPDLGSQSAPACPQVALPPSLVEVHADLQLRALVHPPDREHERDGGRGPASASGATTVLRAQHRRPSRSQHGLRRQLRVATRLAHGLGPVREGVTEGGSIVSANTTYGTPPRPSCSPRVFTLRSSKRCWDTPTSRLP